MQGIERVPVVLIGATLILVLLVLAMLALGLAALTISKVEELHAYRDREALSELRADEDTL